MQVTVHQAKKHLSRLLEAVVRGEEVIIARGKEPIARLVPYQKKRFKLGILKDHLESPLPDFLEPMSEEELRLWEGNE